MHKIVVSYCPHEACRYGEEEGYRVKLSCDVVHDSMLIATLKEPDDAVRFANWKGVELGLDVDLGWKLRDIFGIVKKKKKKEKK